MFLNFFKKILSYAPGIILALILYLLSDGINNVIGTELLGLKKSPISTVMIAIIIGIIMGNAFIPRRGFRIGLEFTQSYILKFGIICLGIRLSFDEFIMHCHIHLIPRRKGDVKDPRGGVRGVIPLKQKYERK